MELVRNGARAAVTLERSALDLPWIEDGKASAVACVGYDASCEILIPEWDTRSYTGSVSSEHVDNQPAGDDADHRDSFRSSIRLAFVIGQCFSLLPTPLHADGKRRFHWWSLRVLYSALVSFGILLNAVLIIVDITEGNAERRLIKATFRAGFYVCNTVVSLLYIRLAVQWPLLCLHFERVEQDMQGDFGYPPNLRRHLNGITITVLSMALVENALFHIAWISKLGFDKKDSIHQILNDYCSDEFPEMTILTHPCNHMGLAVEQALNIIAVFMWNFNDLFIMLISVTIAQRYKLLNITIQHHPAELISRERSKEFWRRARETYNILSTLTEDVDQLLSAQIFVSFLSNLWCICIQLLRSVEDEAKPPLQTSYLLFSFVLLIVRTSFVSLYAASINEESKGVKRLLYSVSSESYCREVERFILQATTEEVALTGLNFYSVTRSFLLTVAGTVITYEIVLVQFNASRSPT